jgi:hypothetical protein
MKRDSKLGWARNSKELQVMSFNERAERALMAYRQIDEAIL